MSVVWDPPVNSFSHPQTLRTAAGAPFDFFCGGDAFLPDGRLLSSGGRRDYGPFKGRRAAAVFDFATEEWSFVAPMDHGRSYLPLIGLGDGRILATAALDESGAEHNEALELSRADTDHWEDRQFTADFASLPLLAHLFLLEDGQGLLLGRAHGRSA